MTERKAREYPEVGDKFINPGFVLQITQSDLAKNEGRFRFYKNEDVRQNIPDEITELEQLRLDLDKACDALEFYAAWESWNRTSESDARQILGKDMSIINNLWIGGKRARKCLALLKRKEGK